MNKFVSHSPNVNIRDNADGTQTVETFGAGDSRIGGSGDTQWIPDNIHSSTVETREADAYNRGLADGLLRASAIVGDAPHLNKSRGVIYEVRKQLAADLREQAKQIREDK